MSKDLSNLEYQSYALNTENSYQYDPVCIEKSVRGTGVLEKIFAFAKKEMSKRFPVLVTFVNQANNRSFESHNRKLGLDVIQEFEFNNNQYYEMACLTEDEI